MLYIRVFIFDTNCRVSAATLQWASADAKYPMSAKQENKHRQLHSLAAVHLFMLFTRHWRHSVTSISNSIHIMIFWWLPIDWFTAGPYSPPTKPDPRPTSVDMCLSFLMNWLGLYIPWSSWLYSTHDGNNYFLILNIISRHMSTCYPSNIIAPCLMSFFVE